MRHPSDGTLRRLLDEPAGVADADREHVGTCPACLSGLAAARTDATLVGAALAVEVAPDVDAAWRRLSGAAAAAGEPRRVPAAAGELRRPPAAAKLRRLPAVPRWRAALRSPVIAVVGVVAILTGATAAAATDWLQIFRAERIAPITVTQADLIQLPELDAYGKVEITSRPNIRAVGDPAAVREVTGLSVPAVRELPRGVTGNPTYQVGGKVGATFTFSTEQAAKTAAAAGQTLPAPPPGLDGSQFRLTAGPGFAAVWPGGSGAPGMAVIKVVAPSAFSAGVPFATARDYLLSLPGLPAAVASQLRAFTGDGTTLPLIVKAGKEKPVTADVNGTPATVLTSQDEVLAGVIWVRDGVINAVGGSLSAEEVLAVARGLRS
jgi:hypothetical protein